MSALASPSLAKKKPPEESQVPGRTEEEKKPVEEAGKKVVAGEKIEKKIKGFRPPSLYLRLVAGGLLGLSLIGGIFFSSAKLKTLVGEIEKKRGQMVALQEKEESLRQLFLALDSVKEEIPLIEEALPDEKRVVDFIREVENLGEKVTIENFSFETDRPQSDPEGNAYIEWTIEVGGPLTDLEEFLGNLLSRPILIRPKVIDIDKMDEETSRVILRAWLYVDPNFSLKENGKD